MSQVDERQPLAVGGSVVWAAVAVGVAAAAISLLKVAFTAQHYGEHNVFYDQYITHRADDELTLLAKLNNEFVFAKDALLMEVDYSLQKNIHAPDLDLYKRRAAELNARFEPSGT